MVNTYAKIQDNTIINIILAQETDDFDPNFTWAIITEVTPTPDVGWTYDGQTFSKPGLPDTAFGQAVTFSTDGVTDYYQVVGTSPAYYFPAGTPQNTVYLKIAIQTQLTNFMLAVQDFVSAKYATQTQIQLLVIYLAALSGGLTNRAAYVAQLFTWVNSITAYSASYTAAVKALTTPADVLAYSWSFGGIAADPQIKLISAISISN